MGQESEETLRVVIMFMQAIVPAARDIMRMTARAAAMGMKDAGRLTIQGAAGIANGVADRLPGRGRYGLVRNVAKGLSQNASLQIVPIDEDTLGRADLAQLNRICRKMQVSFSIVEDPQTGFYGIAYDMKDASAMDAVFRTAIQERLVAKPDVSPTSEIATAIDENSETFRASGLEWRRVDGKEPSYEAAFKSVTGDACVLRVDGSEWSIRDKSGNALVDDAGIARGTCPSPAEALDACIARGRSMADENIRRSNENLKRRPDVTKTMTISGLKRRLNEKEAIAAAKGMKARHVADLPHRKKVAERKMRL